MPRFRAAARGLARVSVIVAMYAVVVSFAPSAAAPARPASPLARLRSGNERFVRALQAGHLSGAAQRAVDVHTRPFAVMLSCADARVAPEHVFAASPGELLVVRSLGTVVDEVVLASLEHGAAGLGVELLVVMGHESCAVVQSAIDGSTTASHNLDVVRSAIRAAIPRSPAEQHELRHAILANVGHVVATVLDRSLVLRERARRGDLDVVGAYFDGSTGAVTFSEPAGTSTLAAVW
jgi:carbonic anhydrase